MEGPKRGGGERVKTPGDAKNLVQGQTPTPRTPGPLRSTACRDRVTIHRSHNVDEGPNLCGYHIDNGGRFRILRWDRLRVRPP